MKTAKNRLEKWMKTAKKQVGKVDENSQKWVGKMDEIMYDIEEKTHTSNVEA